MVGGSFEENLLGVSHESKIFLNFLILRRFWVKLLYSGIFAFVLIIRVGSFHAFHE